MNKEKSSDSSCGRPQLHNNPNSYDANIPEDMDTRTFGTTPQHVSCLLKNLQSNERHVKSSQSPASLRERKVARKSANLSQPSSREQSVSKRARKSNLVATPLFIKTETVHVQAQPVSTKVPSQSSPRLQNTPEHFIEKEDDKEDDVMIHMTPSKAAPKALKSSSDSEKLVWVHFKRAQHLAYLLPAAEVNVNQSYICVRWKSTGQVEHIAKNSVTIEYIPLTSQRSTRSNRKSPFQAQADEDARVKQEIKIKTKEGGKSESSYPPLVQPQNCDNKFIPPTSQYAK